METTLSGSLVMKERKKERERKRESLDIACLLNKRLEGRAKGDSESISMIGIEVLEEAGGVAEEHMRKGGKILCRRPQGS